MNDLRVLYVGMLGEFSRRPLPSLLAAGIRVVGVCVPSAEKGPGIRRLEPVTAVSQLPILTPFAAPNLIHTAWEHHIPVFAIGRLSAEMQALIRELAPDVACVACFDQRIPTKVLSIPRYGFLNVHPALLPDFRGPAPLFWTFHAGISETGVTVHFMDDGLDTGDIALQAPLSLPDGISGPAADALAADLGGQLLVEAITQLQAGTLPRRPQGANGRSYPSPQPADFHIPTSWPARRAFNFMRGTASWERPFIIETDSERLAAKTAVAYSAQGQLPRPVTQENGRTHIQFTPGILTIATD